MALYNKAKEDFRTPNALRGFKKYLCYRFPKLRVAFGVRKSSFALL